VTQLEVGVLVVYGSHGIGRVVARREDAVELEFPASLTVTLPMERALLAVRPVSTPDELLRVEQVLQDDRTDSPQTWSKRLRAMQEKVASGEIVAWAELARDGIKHDQTRLRNGGKPSAPSERQVYMKARALLAAEVATVRKTDTDEADAWIVEQVTVQ
jgi:CarD family transcriptional regulator